MSDTYFDFCALCQRTVLNPCQPDPDKTNHVAVPEIAPPFDISEPIVALSKKALLTRLMACMIGRMIARLGLSRAEVRGYVMFRIEQALANGVTFKWDNGDPMVITPEVIDFAFDRRRDQELSDKDEKWDDELCSYDRAISDLVNRAVAGDIKSKPDQRWYMRFLFIRLAAACPIFDMPGDD